MKIRGRTKIADMPRMDGIVMIQDLLYQYMLKVEKVRDIMYLLQDY